MIYGVLYQLIVLKIIRPIRVHFHFRFESFRMYRKCSRLFTNFRLKIIELAKGLMEPNSVIFSHFFLTRSSFFYEKFETKISDCGSKITPNKIVSLIPHCGMLDNDNRHHPKTFTPLLKFISLILMFMTHRTLTESFQINNMTFDNGCNVFGN